MTHPRDQLAAVDFTTVEIWTTKGLVTFYLLFAMHLATRRVRFVGCTPNRGGPWMAQAARELTNGEDGFLTAPVTHALMDRDTKFTAEFLAILENAGVKAVLLPASSPNCNAHLERFFRSLKDEAVDRMIFFSEKSLRNAVRDYLAHFHAERNHQGLDHKIIDPGSEVGQTNR